MASYEYYLKKEKEEEKEVLKKWNKNNPDQKLSTTDYTDYGSKNSESTGKSVTTTGYNKTEKKKKKKKKTTTTASKDKNRRRAQSTDRSGKKSQSSKRTTRTKNTDIAPVRSDKKKTTDTQKRTTFQKGLLKDGYDKGDITLSILGSAGDAAEKFGKGFLNVSESYIDNIALGVEKAAKVLDNKKIETWARDFQERDFMGGVVDNTTNLFNRMLTVGMEKPAQQRMNTMMQNADIEDSSFLGDRADSYMQAVGQWAAQSMLQQNVGVNWRITTASTAMSGAMKEARERGASEEDGFKQGIADAVAEVIAESMFGGAGVVGGKGFVNPLKEQLTKGLKNSTAKALAKYTFDFTGEGVEEVVSQFISNFGRKFTFDKDKDLKELLFSEEARDQYIESYISGGLLSGAINAKRVYKSAKTGRDYETGLSANEEAVVEAEINKRVKKRQTQQAENKRKHEIEDAVQKAIENHEATYGPASEDTKKIVKEKALAEFDGKELDLDSFKPTKKELNKIIEEVDRDLREGYMDISTIEETLLGENIAKIRELESREGKTPEEKQALQSELNDLKTETYRQFKTILKDDYVLNETYKQSRLKDQTYVYEESSDDTEITKKLAKSAVDAKLGNDKRSRDYFGLVNNIANDMSMEVGFVNNEILNTLKGTNEYDDLKKVKDVRGIDGMVVELKDGTKKLLINVETHRPLNVVTGHETTHLFEGTDDYKKLSAVVEDFAREKGIWDEYIANYTELYDGIIAKDDKNREEKIKREVIAQLCGEYVLTDETFINNLSVKEPNIFKRVYDNIKHMVKMATAGSAEERKLLEAKRMFEKTYRQMDKKKLDGSTKYHISKTFSEEIDKTIEGEMPEGSQLKARDYTPKVLVDNGVKDLPMLITQKHAKSVIYSEEEAKQLGLSMKNNYHGLGKELLMKSVDNMDDPIAIYKQDDDHYLIITEVKDKAGDNVIIPVKIDGKGTYNDVYIDENQILSVYGKQNLEAYLKKNNFKEVYTKKGIALNPEVQFPDISDSFIESISDTNEKVNVTEGGTTTKLSLTSWNNTDKAKVEENLVNAGFTKEVADKWIDDVNSIAAIIAQNRDRLDYEAASNQTMLKKNQEYVRTLDSSTLCAKRLLFQGTYDAIQHAMPGKALLADDVIKLRRMMDEEGYEVPCGICYVESRRKSLGKFASQWLEEYDGEYIPTLDEVIATDGLEKLRVEHPKTYQDFVKAMKKKGVANPKLVELRTDYRGDIRKLNKRTINKITRIGGLRIQSFSDFETPHLIDMMQAVLDMSAKKLTAQAYTKVPNFAWVFGNTGIKINLSLIGDVDENGNLTFDGKEGMKIEDAMALREAYSENVGTILVGKNKEHILAAMADDRIDFIIPFHRSGWGSAEYEKLGLQGYQDFTYEQTEKNLDGTKREDGSLYSIDYWDFSKSGKENAEKYLELCKEQGRIPVFSSFLQNNGDGSWSLQPDGSTDGYWKMLIDYKMYDNNGVGSPQMKVTPNFNMKEAKRVLDEYEGGANKLPVAQDIVDKFVSQYNEDIAPLPNNTKFSLSSNESSITDEDMDILLEYDLIENLKEKNPSEQYDEIMDYILSGKYEKATEYINEAVTDQKTKEDLLFEIDFAKFEDELPDFDLEMEMWLDETRSIKEDIKEAKKNLQPVVKTSEFVVDTETETARYTDERIDNILREYGASDENYAKAHVSSINPDSFLKLTLPAENREKWDNAVGKTDDLFELDVEKLKKQIQSPYLIVNNYGDVIGHEGRHRMRALYAAGIKNAPVVIINYDTKYSKQKENSLVLTAQDFYGDGPVNDGYRVEVNNLIPTNPKYKEEIVAAYGGDATVRFSRSGETPYNQILPAGAYEVYGKDVKQKSAVEDIAPVKELNNDVEEADPTMFEPVEENIVEKTRKELREALIENDKDFLVNALDNARPGGRLFRLLLNNTDTIRANEIVFGREAGSKINELIFQKEIDNEAKSIAWQNKERSDIRKLGIRAKDFLGRPTAESAAVQKYGEGKYVNQYGEIMKYGDEELEREFKDGATQEKIKFAARVIREKYDTYIDTANEVLTGLGFDPIPKRDDYMRHFQELNDIFSRFGVPFNPKEMQEHTLPTDINGLTEFWSPQKNYFANAQPRKGIRTEYDAITGIDGYISGIANLIYHTEDIQRGRAFEALIRERYNSDLTEADLPTLTDEEMAERFEKIQNNHLAKYAAWLHEWTNNIAGKKSKTDRAMEETADREGLSILDTLRKSVGVGMIGFNISSSMTNLIAPAQAMAKTNKVAMFKGTVDTVRNIFQKDDFVDKNSFLTSRFGTDALSKTPYQKIQDAGFVFMKGVDYFSSNVIVRSKYAELKAKGMSEEQAHKEAGKFAARIMGDRTKGANAQLYNSKLFNVLGQFQLEVNNQLYSMFYDTYHDSKENAEESSAKMAAGVTFTLGQLFVYNHLFGKAFESIAGYNPTFDVIGIVMTALGLGDEEEEDVSKRLKDAADQLVDALPYVNTFTGGGRIPVSNAIPNLVSYATGGTDQYGNELTLSSELEKLIYLVPGGNQIKKTYQGLKMFDDDLPVKGSYTDSGELRFPVEDTIPNRIQAGLFGQWANENAQEYFDGEHDPLKEKQIQEYKDLDIPIKDYWDIREGMSGLKKNEEKVDYINSLDLPISKKNILANNALDRKEQVDLTGYGDYGSLEEFDSAVKNPGKYAVANAIGGYEAYESYMSDIGEFRADKDENGKRINGSAKEKVTNYINGLDIDYGSKIILFKSKYKDDDTYNYDIIEYLNGRDDITYDDMVKILEELDFTVDAEGNVRW